MLASNEKTRTRNKIIAIGKKCKQKVPIFNIICKRKLLRNDVDYYGFNQTKSTYHIAIKKYEISYPKYNDACTSVSLLGYRLLRLVFFFFLLSR